MKKFVILMLTLCNFAFAQGKSDSGSSQVATWFNSKVNEAISLVESEDKATAESVKEEWKKYTVSEATATDYTQPVAKQEEGKLVVDALLLSGHRVDLKATGKSVLVTQSFMSAINQSALRESGYQRNWTNTLLYPAISCFQVVFGENKAFMNTLLNATNKLGTSYRMLE